MKKLLYFLLFCCLISCSNSAHSDITTTSSRAKAIEKQKEAFMLNWDTVLYKFKDNADTLRLALSLLDEAISLDTTYLAAYQTKVTFLSHAKDYEKALEVCNLIFERNLAPKDGSIYLIRGGLYSRLNRLDLALADYKEGISVCEETLKKEPDNFQALSNRAGLLLLSESRERGMHEFNLLKNKPLNEHNRKAIEMMLSRLAQNEDVESFVQDTFFQ